MTNYINTGGITKTIFSTTPELNDSLAKGAVFQKDLQTQGSPIGTAVGFVNGAPYNPTPPVPNPATDLTTYPFAAPNNGPLLRVIDGSDGFRYVLARFDGVLTADLVTSGVATNLYPVASTAKGTLLSIGYQMTVTQTASGFTTAIVPIFPGGNIGNFLSTGGFIVWLSDDVDDTESQALPSSTNPTTVNTYGGFCVYLKDKSNFVDPSVLLPVGKYTTQANFVAPKSYINSQRYIPAYGSPNTGLSQNVTQYIITVGDYVWLQTGKMPAQIPTVTSKTK